MIQILLNSIALEPNRWTKDKSAYFSLDKLLEPIARSDFHFIEIWQYHLSRLSITDIENIKIAGNSLDLKFPVVGMYPKLHLSGTERQKQLDEITRLMDYSKSLDAEIIKTFAGAIGTDKITDSERQKSIEFMHEVLELANSYGLIITAETHPNTLCDNLETTQNFLKTINSPNLKLCYQPFDFFNTDVAINDYCRLSSDVIHIHYQGQKDGKMELLINSDIDYQKLTSKLVEYRFSGKICIEFVKDCVVMKPEDLDIATVLANARQDRDFIVNLLRGYDKVSLQY